MFDYQKSELAELANEHRFVRDTLEKVIRLTEILSYISQNPTMKNSLALKRGTAINLAVLDLPRLSVDIDLDFCENVNKEDMVLRREAIENELLNYMATQGYKLSPHSKKRFSLDSYVFTYRNLGNTNDNLKVEINYSLRSHIFKPSVRKITSTMLNNNISVLTLEPIEIYSAKINALLSRSAARDLCDTYNMIKMGLFDERLDLLRKCVVIYTAISQENISEHYDLSLIDNIDFNKIKSDLLPVIKKGAYVNLDEMKDTVKGFLAELLVLTKNEQDFIKKFNQGILTPNLVFDNVEIVERISSNPMLIWKISNNRLNQGATEETSSNNKQLDEEDEDYDLEL